VVFGQVSPIGFPPPVAVATNAAGDTPASRREAGGYRV
jgi:hypothetical protein